MVVDLNGTSAGSDVCCLTDFNGALFFRANNKVWKSDGTAAGTSLVNPNGGSNPWCFVPANGLLYFFDTTPDTGEELWVTDGTSIGTHIVEDINSGPATSTVTAVTPMGGKIYFAADDGIHGAELWIGDGTPDGTRMVKDIYPGTGSGIPLSNWEMARVGGTLYFAAGNPNDGYGLWKSDGTEEGTVIVHDFTPPAGWLLTVVGLTPVSNRLFFLADDYVHGIEPWVSDGTPGGTFMIADVNPGSAGSCPFMECFWENGAIGEKFLFAAQEPLGIRLWVSEGVLGDAFPLDVYGPSWFSKVGNALYFTAWTDASTYGLWRTDGTEAGTYLVKVINPGPCCNWQSEPGPVTNVFGTAYFNASDGIHGRELWKSDGTEAGTVMVADLFPGSGSSNPGGLTMSGGTMFFAADDGIHGLELWAIDAGSIPALGSGALTLLFVSLGCAGGFLIFRRGQRRELP